MGNKETTVEEVAAGFGIEWAEDKLYFVRLNFSERVQHMIFVISFVVLVITGFMIKIPEDIVVKLGETGQIVFYYRSIMHRIAGVIMILVSIYHLYYLIFKPAGRLWLKDMMPKVKDLTDMIGNIRYYLGLAENHPEFDRFCYKHKLEYGALFAGTTLMAVTGVLMWTEHLWYKFILDIATLVHGMEAILACLAIMVWHLYEVHLRPHKFPIDNMWITGVIDEDEMKEEFPLHYKKIMNDPELKKIYIKK
ncbi:MAG: cytochrome b/b6 domain-containing protein [Desulfobacterales bacterium]|uniref:Cytochrome b/b6 domain-containing protein n=1 Tax=Candidatus Desulfatibia vada TaxID=2841696 RepID=A0A8J6NSR4_9BACT|nr:cytochrome b/b6 domain-containing protein [Candidatus Desulfatibia vada]MBL6971758.1 cytochrome b/b6 domain-containing protein [Desulfobacterales bacterium]